MIFISFQFLFWSIVIRYTMIYYFFFSDDTQKQLVLVTASQFCFLVKIEIQ